MTPPAVNLKGIGRTYPGPPPVAALRSVDLQVKTGDYVAVIGPSGSGKSTLLNLLGLLDRPTDGTYTLGGIDVSRLDEKGRAAYRGQQIGFVFQAFHLIDHQSAIENVLLAALYQPEKMPRAALKTQAKRVLEQVGMGHRLNAPPSTLSGGERQRVAIARALMNKPALLLCDEPTGNLDSVNAHKVLEMLQEVNQSGQTVVVITHDATVAAAANRRVSITDGILTDVA